MVKKKYVKPELLYENFQLSQHIAACHYQVNFKKDQVKACEVIDIGDMGTNPGNTFVTGFACTTPVGDQEEYCYENGTLGSNFFAS